MSTPFEKNGLSGCKGTGHKENEYPYCSSE